MSNLSTRSHQTSLHPQTEWQTEAARPIDVTRSRMHDAVKCKHIIFLWPDLMFDQGLGLGL